MSVSLQKDAHFLLADLVPGLQEVFIGIGWEAQKLDDTPFVLDASLFLLGANGLVRRDEDFVFYNQQTDHDQSVRYVKEIDDSVIGNDREGFVVSIPRLPGSVDRLVCGLTIEDAATRRQNFGMLPWVHIRLVNQTDKIEIARYHLTGSSPLETTLLLGELQRQEQGWKFQALGQSFGGGLGELATYFGVKLDADTPSAEGEFYVAGETGGQQEEAPSPKEETAEAEEVNPLLKKKRRSSGELIAVHAEKLKEQMKSILPRITMASLNQCNESQTRMILDRILQDALGYQMEDIKAEQKIQGRKADYVLTIDGVQTVVIETKRVGLPLRDKQIFQATSYAAYAGIHWALLTNVVTWQLYRVSTNEKVEANLVFEIDLQNGFNESDAFHLTLLSKFGMARQGLLEKLWIKRTALSCESLISAILNEEVISKIRALIVKETNCQVTNQEIQAAIEKDILDL